MHIASADVRQKTEGVVERRMKRRESVETQDRLVESSPETSKRTSEPRRRSAGQVVPQRVQSKLHGLIDSYPLYFFSAVVGDDSNPLQNCYRKQQCLFYELPTGPVAYASLWHLLSAAMPLLPLNPRPHPLLPAILCPYQT